MMSSWERRRAADIIVLAPPHPFLTARVGIDYIILAASLFDALF